MVCTVGLGTPIYFCDMTFLECFVVLRLLYIGEIVDEIVCI